MGDGSRLEPGRGLVPWEFDSLLLRPRAGMVTGSAILTGPGWIPGDLRSCPVRLLGRPSDCRSDVDGFDSRTGRYAGEVSTAAHGVANAGERVQLSPPALEGDL